MRTPGLLCGFGWHRYREIGAGQHIHRYLECVRCGDRTVRFASAGYQPLKARWLAGGPWEEPAPSGLPVQYIAKPEILTALVELGDCLASAFQIAQREGRQDDALGAASWNLAADHFSAMLRKHHAAIVAARKAVNHECPFPNS